MKLTAKLMVVFMLGIIALTTLNAYVTLRREEELFVDETRALALGTGALMSPVLKLAWRSQGEEGAQAIIRNVTKDFLDVRWVWFDAREDEEHGPRTTPVAHGEPRLLKMGGGVEKVVMYYRVDVKAPRSGGLEFSRSLDTLKDKQQDLLVLTLLLTGGMVLLTGGIMAWTGAAFVAQPLNLLIEKTRRIAQGDFSGPLHLHTQDELSELSDSVNEMCEQLSAAQARVENEMAARIAAVEQLRHADRLKTVGRLASGVAHELGTPLNVIAGRAGLIASGKLSEPEASESAEIIRAQSQQMAEIIRQLLDYSRQQTPRRVDVDLKNVVSQTIELLAPLAQKRRVEIDTALSDTPMWGRVDVGQIQQVLSNLVINGIQAQPSGGRVRVSIHRETAQVVATDGSDSAAAAAEGRSPEYFVISVRDEGCGIAEEDRDHLFEPFFTTKDVGEGTGLGLSISHAIVQEHGGWIEVDSELGEGSTFSVFLPTEVAESRRTQTFDAESRG